MKSYWKALPQYLSTVRYETAVPGRDVMSHIPLGITVNIVIIHRAKFSSWLPKISVLDEYESTAVADAVGVAIVGPVVAMKSELSKPHTVSA